MATNPIACIVISSIFYTTICSVAPPSICMASDLLFHLGIRRSTGSNQVLFCTGHGTKAFPILLTRAVLNLAWPSSTASMMPCSDGLSLATWIVHCSQNSFGMSRLWKQYGGTWIWSFKQCVNFATGCKRGVTG